MFSVRHAPPGGSGKAEGFADGGWASHRQAVACRCHPLICYVAVASLLGAMLTLA
jgi:hypothetical protein